MKKFVLNIGVFLVLYLIISQVITSQSHYAFANKYFYRKIKSLELQYSNGETYNTFFIGPSTTYRQINPEVFDNYFNSDRDNEIKSYNLGIANLQYPTAFYLLDNFLNSEISKDTKYIFLDIRNIDSLGIKFQHKQRGNFSKTIELSSFVWNSNYINQVSIGNQLKSIKNYSIALLEKRLLFGHFGTQFLSLKSFYAKDKNKNGFNPLTLSDKSSKKRHKTLIDNLEIIDSDKKDILKIYSANNSKYDRGYYLKLLELRKELKSKNIDLIFILPPRRGDIISLFKQLPKNCTIDLSNPNKYPEFYEFENLFDRKHLNLKGSKLYTEALAREFESVKKDF